MGEIFLASIDSLRDDRLDPTRFGLDAAVEFQPDWLNLGAPVEETADGTAIDDYDTIVDRMCQKPSPTHRHFKCVTTGWDNTARRKKAATVLAGSTPERYRQWLERAIAASRPGSHGERVGFINAWNEWAEGAHLEPCQKWGRAYLEATRAAVARTAPAATSVPARIAVEDSYRRRRLTVCIPTYNGARYLHEAIASVLKQSLADFDLLIVDDASSDETRLVVERFDDPRIRSVWNDVRLGLVGNWNRAVALCRSDYICLFHQDDVMGRRTWHGSQHSSTNIRRSASSAPAPRRSVPTANLVEQSPVDAGRGLQSGLDFFFRLLEGPNIVCGSSVVLRASCLERLGPFDPSLPFTTDLEMWLRMSAHHDVGYLPDALVQYRRHEHCGECTTLSLGAGLSLEGPAAFRILR